MVTFLLERYFYLILILNMIFTVNRRVEYTDFNLMLYLANISNSKIVRNTLRYWNIWKQKYIERVFYKVNF